MDSVNLHQNRLSTPSIFEIVASETMDDLIYPALKRVWDYLILWYETNWPPANRNSSKIRLIVLYRILRPEVITWCLQYLYLRERDGSLGECFYGLQRFNSNNGTNDTKDNSLLTNKRKLISATILTALPYFTTTFQNNAKLHCSTTFQDYFMKAYHLYRMYKAWHLLCYQAGATNYPSPICKWLRILLLYPTEESNLQSRKSRITKWIFFLMEVGSFLLQFSQRWYDGDIPKRRKNFGGVSDNPPAPFADDQKKEVPDGICGICWQTISNPTACAISGYVYCWRCIMKHLDENEQTCPMTGYAISVDDLVRIYD